MGLSHGCDFILFSFGFTYFDLRVFRQTAALTGLQHTVYGAHTLSRNTFTHTHKRTEIRMQAHTQQLGPWSAALQQPYLIKACQHS